MTRPTIVVAGMCDTKGPELRFLAEQVAVHGGAPLVMDLSLGGEVEWADVTLRQVLATTRTCPTDVFGATRAEAIELVGRAGVEAALRLRADGRLDGIVSWAGSVGTTVVTRVMRALPFGVPKVMLTDMASGDVGPWLAHHDIWLADPIAEQGVNVVTRTAVGNAAAAVVAMATRPQVAGTAPLCAITGYGTTTPCVTRLRAGMEARGWEVAVFHAVGAGAAMEDLIREGRIGALLDVTPGEMLNTIVGGVYGVPPSWAGRRMTAAAETGIPQVVAPGGLDQCALGPLATVPASILEEMASGRRGSRDGSRVPYSHNEAVTIVSPTLDEIEEVGRRMVHALSATTAATQVLIPMRGWSAYDQPASSAGVDRGWPAGHGDGPTWEPDASRPGWSRRAVVLERVLSERLDRSNPRLDLLAVDLHLLDPAFAELAARCLLEMLEGTWSPGRHGASGAPAEG
ncbi:MAG TPA: Tm-1-like ATP-binding domain-containing protein [Candidatus Dormibacteraeota bacterium]|nr:Tm-1-like ATP-binding domain-containing protein [Candidatus Dormibacteraeota bacterium]